MSREATSERRRSAGYVRPYEPGDRASMFALLERVWGPQVAGTLESLWDWRMATPDFTPGATIGMVLDEGAGVSGVITLTPVRFYTAGKLVDAVWGGEFVVDQRHRGKGLVLLKRVMQRTDPFLGAPNELSRPILERYGMTEVCTIENRTHVVRVGRSIARRTGLRWLGAAADLVLGGARAAAALLPTRRDERGVTVSRVTAFDSRFDDLWARAAPRHGILAIRDARHLTWRFVDRPSRTYDVAAAERDGRLAGYVAYYAAERHGVLYGHLVDFLVDGEDRGVRDALFAHATRALVQRGVDLVNCYLPPDAAFYRDGLRRCGFWLGSPKQIVLMKSPHSGTFPAGARWFFTRADSDLDLM